MNCFQGIFRWFGAALVAVSMTVTVTDVFALCTLGDGCKSGCTINAGGTCPGIATCSPGYLGNKCSTCSCLKSSPPGGAAFCYCQ